MSDFLFDCPKVEVDLLELPQGTSWLNKLTIEYIDEEDGTGCLSIDWDDTDPELEAWTNLGAEKQEAFIIQALTNAIDSAIAHDVF